MFLTDNLLKCGRPPLKIKGLCGHSFLLGFTTDCGYAGVYHQGISGATDLVLLARSYGILLNADSYHITHLEKTE
jgi:hypothetical protein